MRILTQLILPAAAVALAIPGLALQAQAQGADDCTSSAHLAPLTLNSKRHFSAHCCSSLAR